MTNNEKLEHAMRVTFEKYPLKQNDSIYFALVSYLCKNNPNGFTREFQARDIIQSLTKEDILQALLYNSVQINNYMHVNFNDTAFVRKYINNHQIIEYISNNDIESIMKMFDDGLEEVQKEIEYLNSHFIYSSHDREKQKQTFKDAIKASDFQLYTSTQVVDTMIDNYINSEVIERQINCTDFINVPSDQKLISNIISYFESQRKK